MKRCITCLYPDTKPDLHFDEKGECSACRSTRKRKDIDWDKRQKDLEKILNDNNGECIVASSGGKDSHYIALTLLELGAHVTIVTATTCHLTEMGRRNIDNLARYATTIEVSPNKPVRAKLNKLGLQLVGDISWPEHVSIFTTPFKIACDVGIPLIFYGECPQEAYGGPEGTDVAIRLDARWRSEFGGFLGLRPSDMIGQEGIFARDMKDYELPVPTCGYEDDRVPDAYFLGQFYPWDSHKNAEVAINHGMEYQVPGSSNYWVWENLDNAHTGLHDYMMFRKFGYGRACGQISVDIRNGLITREAGEEWIRKNEGHFPYTYMGVHIDEILENIGMKWSELSQLVVQFSDPKVA